MTKPMEKLQLDTYKLVITRNDIDEHKVHYQTELDLDFQVVLDNAVDT